MTIDEVFEGVRKVLLDVTFFQPDEIHSDSYLGNDLEMDSLDYLDTVRLLGNEFQVNIKEDELAQAIVSYRQEAGDKLRRGGYDPKVEDLCRYLRERGISKS